MKATRYIINFQHWRGENSKIESATGIIHNTIANGLVMNDIKKLINTCFKAGYNVQLINSSIDKDTDLQKIVFFIDNGRFKQS